MNHLIILCNPRIMCLVLFYMIECWRAPNHNHGFILDKMNMEVDSGWFGPLWIWNMSSIASV